MPGPITKLWQPADVARLLTLADSGASLMRASAALGRTTMSVQKKANQLGTSFAGVRKVRAELRASGALDPLEKR